MSMRDIKKFFFYPLYTWDPDDFENFETWMYRYIDSLTEGAQGAAVLKGFRPSGAGGMNMGLTAGIAVNATGRLVADDSSQSTTIASPVGNPARTLVVLRPKTENVDTIPEPENPSNPVPLHEKLDYDLVVLNGSPAANPSYPAITAGDIVVAALKLTSGHVTITESDFDWGMVDRPRKRKHRVKRVTASASLAQGDEIVEIDFSAATGQIDLLSPADCEGEKFTFVRMDDSGNNGKLVGSINGLSELDIDEQGQSVTVYSNGVGYMVI